MIDVKKESEESDSSVTLTVVFSEDHRERDGEQVTGANVTVTEAKQTKQFR